MPRPVLTAMQESSTYVEFFYAEDSKPIYKESTLYYYLVKDLREAGYDVVRQVPAKDGHLTSAAYYIRDRKGRWALIDGYYAIRAITKEFNDTCRVLLTLHGTMQKAA